MLQGTRGDLIYALRVLRRSPAFALVAVLTLAVGIGATTVMFSVVHGVLIRPLPVRDQASIAVMSMHDRHNISAHLPISYSVFRQLRESDRTFVDVAAMHMLGASTWIVRDGAHVLSVEGALVSGNLFAVLGAPPVLGRTLTAEDGVPGQPKVAVLSSTAWRRHFGADSAVIGRSLRMLGDLYTVVGVMPDGLEFPRGAQLWAPLVGDPDEAWLDLVGRVRPEASLEQAEAELAEIVRGQQHSVGVDRVIIARPLAHVIIGDMRIRLLVLSAAVALVLLIACGNVAMLILGRGEARAREVAVRGALGAGGWRIVRQLLTESIVLAVLGGVAGVFVAIGLLGVLMTFAPPELPRIDGVRVDGPTFLFAAGVSGLTVLLSGLAPAVREVRVNTAAVLKTGARVVVGGWQHEFGRRLLMTVQVALALIVLVGAALLVRSLAKQQTVDLGFAKEQLVIAQAVAEKADENRSLAAYASMFDAVRADLLELPGVIGVTPLAVPPFSGSAGLDLQIILDGQAEIEGAEYPAVSIQIVSEDFFRSFEIPLRRGRIFAETDHANALPVVVVDEALAHMLWPGDDPIGHSVRLGTASTTSRTVIGVAADTRYRDATRIRPTVYLPVQQATVWPAYFAVRTNTDPRTVLPLIRRTIDEGGLLRIASLATVVDLLAEPLARPRFSTLLLATFAVIALTLAAVGVYSVLALFVRQRTHEVGVRMALGANRTNVHRMVLWQGMKVGLVGVGLGMIAAVFATRTLETLLFDVAPNDPLTLTGAAVFLLLVVGVACWFPARRATRVSPMTALRSE